MGQTKGGLNESSDTVVRQIDETRSEIDALLDEVATRLQPNHLLQVAQSWWQDRAVDLARSSSPPDWLAPAARRPIATAGAAFGLGLLVGIVWGKARLTD